MALRIATYNIHRCIGRDGVENPERIIGVLDEIDADIVALQEVAVNSKRLKNVLAQLADSIGAMAIQGFTLVEENGRYGNAMLTRIKVSKINRIDISLPGREPRGIIETVLKINNCNVLILATHLGLSPGERRFQTRHILSILEMSTADVSILLGDFNEWFSWGRPLRWLRKWFAPLPAPATFPVQRPLFGLDRFWIRPANKLLSLKPHISALSRTASDHLPLVAEVRI